MRYQLGRYDANIISKAELIVITGNDETALFCRNVADTVRRYNNEQGDLWVCESLAEFEQRARTPAFFGRWWYSGSADRLSPEDKKAFDRLLKKPLEYGTAVLVGVDFSKYNYVTKGTRKSPVAHEITTSFPSKRFLMSHLQREFTERGACVTQAGAEAFIWRLGDAYSKYEYYIDLVASELPNGVVEVKKEHVIATLRGVQGASFDEFLKYLLRPLSSGALKRSTKLFKTYQCMLEDGALLTLRKLHNKSVQYMELRRLINVGYIPVGVEFSVESLAKLLRVKEADEGEEETEKKQKQAGGKFSYKDILKWSDMKFKREVETASQVPLSDWYNIVKLSGTTCYTDREAEVVLFDILTRTRRVDDNLI